MLCYKAYHNFSPIRRLTYQNLLQTCYWASLKEFSTPKNTLPSDVSAETTIPTKELFSTSMIFPFI